jgi:hypothetical protein
MVSPACMRVCERNTFIDVVCDGSSELSRKPSRRRTEPSSLLSAQIARAAEEVVTRYSSANFADDGASDASTGDDSSEGTPTVSNLTSDRSCEDIPQKPSISSVVEKSTSGSNAEENVAQLSPNRSDGETSSALGAAKSQGFAGKALRLRMQAAFGVPSWASFLPAEARAVAGWQSGHGKQSLDKDHHRATGVGFVEEVSFTPSVGAARRGFATTRLSGRVWTLSKCPHGCREVQLAFDKATSDIELAELASELRGHVWEALQCPHANHVLQKCISTMKRQALQFIIDEIMARPGAPTKASQHKYGCRVVQRLLECCASEQVRDLVDSILSDASTLVSSVFGNYVIQQLLEHGAGEQWECLMQLLERDVAELALDPYASAVVSKALSMESATGRTGVTRAVLHEPGLLARMAVARHAHVGVKAILRKTGEGQRLAVAALRAESDLLATSRYGKVVEAHLK